MRIVVLVKYVPDVTVTPAFAAGRLVRTAGTLNELDEHAVEAALRLVESVGAGDGSGHEVIAVTMSPAGGDLAVRKAFQLGAQRGIRITDDAIAGSDVFGTTAVLAAAVRKLAPDLVITGMSATDGQGGVVPVLLADALGWPALTLADAVVATGGTTAPIKAVTITRASDGTVEQWRAPLPVVLSVTDAANTARQANFKLIMAARKNPIEVWTLADLGLAAADVGAAGARTQVVCATPAPARPPAVLVTDADGGGGARLAEYLLAQELP